MTQDEQKRTVAREAIKHVVDDAVIGIGSGSTADYFIELRDVNYPGSTYDLTYDAQSDSLRGIYFQATQEQQFEVVFKRRD